MIKDLFDCVYMYVIVLFRKMYWMKEKNLNNGIC